MLEVLHHQIANDLKKLNNPVDREYWGISPAVVNAYYNFGYNRIMFPAGILQPPYYHKDQPKSLSYGGIGSLIGHEITHGFDDQGSQYDKYGNLNQWWDDVSASKFKERAMCMVKQYMNYTLPEAGGMRLTGYKTLGENIADNGGIKQSFKAYRQWIDRMGREENILPGLNLTNDQLFFINFAQQRCTNYLEKSAINNIMTSSHSPARFRVIGTLQNNVEFSRVYNCPLGSYMNPPHKCQVW